MIGGVHYLITRGGSRPQEDSFNDCREPPYPVRGGCTRLLFLAEDETRTRGNASITCKTTVRLLRRAASSISAHPRRGRARRRRRRRRLSPLVGRRNWVNPTGSVLSVSEGKSPSSDEHGAHICQSPRISDARGETRFAKARRGNRIHDDDGGGGGCSGDNDGRCVYSRNVRRNKIRRVFRFCLSERTL